MMKIEPFEPNENVVELTKRILAMNEAILRQNEMLLRMLTCVVAIQEKEHNG